MKLSTFARAAAIAAPIFLCALPGVAQVSQKFLRSYPYSGYDGYAVKKTLVDSTGNMWVISDFESIITSTYPNPEAFENWHIQYISGTTGAELGPSVDWDAPGGNMFSNDDTRYADGSYQPWWSTDGQDNPEDAALDSHGDLVVVGKIQVTNTPPGDHFVANYSEPFQNYFTFAVKKFHWTGSSIVDAWGNGGYRAIGLSNVSTTVTSAAVSPYTTQTVASTVGMQPGDTVYFPNESQTTTVTTADVTTPTILVTAGAVQTQAGDPIIDLSQWVTVNGGAYAVVIGSNDQIYVSGSYGPPGARDLIVAEYNSSGVLQASNTQNVGGDDVGYLLALDSAHGDLYATAVRDTTTFKSYKYALGAGGLLPATYTLATTYPPSGANSMYPTGCALSPNGDFLYLVGWVAGGANEYDTVVSQIPTGTMVITNDASPSLPDGWPKSVGPKLGKLINPSTDNHPCGIAIQDTGSGSHTIWIGMTRYITASGGYVAAAEAWSQLEPAGGSPVASNVVDKSWGSAGTTGMTCLFDPNNSIFYLGTAYQNGSTNQLGLLKITPGGVITPFTWSAVTGVPAIGAACIFLHTSANMIGLARVSHVANESVDTRHSYLDANNPVSNLEISGYIP